eukprot:TRINITY_DN3238_c0_g1_i1.p1 TRINITY_DN3238_c0_g1~~TRINITY_DN3238_c0_g1_i1.p1  ORF type:complete len:933 (+),score=135.02 TRINITY_DN3238_c0_g1_i1:375-2801(+)
MLCCFFAFCLDILLTSYVFREEYWLSLYFPLDILATGTLPLAFVRLFGAGVNGRVYSNLYLSRIGRIAQAFARLGKLAKALRILKLCGSRRSRSSVNLAALARQEAGSFEDDDSASSMIGKRLEAVTRRNVIAGVLLMFFVGLATDLVVESIALSPAFEMAVTYLDQHPSVSSSNSTDCSQRDYQMEMLRFMKQQYGKSIVFLRVKDTTYIPKGQAANGLRDQEMLKWTSGQSELWIDNQKRAMVISGLNLFLSLFVLAMLSAGLWAFSREALSLLSKPVEQMLLLLTDMQGNPLTASPDRSPETEISCLVATFRRLLDKFYRDARQAAADAHLAGKVIEQLSVKDIDGAADLVDEADGTASEGLHASLARIVGLVRQWAPYLPDTLFVADTEDSECYSEDATPIRDNAVTEFNPVDKRPSLFLPGEVMNPFLARESPAPTAPHRPSLPAPPLSGRPSLGRASPETAPTSRRDSVAVPGLGNGAVHRAASVKKPNLVRELVRREATLLHLTLTQFHTVYTDPQRTEQVYSELLPQLVATIKQHRGYIAFVCAESIIASWNTVQATRGHPRHACSCAMALRTLLSEYTHPLLGTVAGAPSAPSPTKAKAVATVAAQAKGVPFQIALVSDHVIFGNVGSDAFSTFQLIGGSVPLARELATLGRVLQAPVVMGKNVSDQVTDMFQTRLVDVVTWANSSPLRNVALEFQVYECVKEHAPAGDEWMYEIQQSEADMATALQHYTRGFALLQRGRLIDARDALSLHCTLSPEDKVASRLLQVCEARLQSADDRGLRYTREHGSAWTLFPGELAN